MREHTWDGEERRPSARPSAAGVTRTGALPRGAYAYGAAAPSEAAVHDAVVSRVGYKRAALICGSAT